MGNSNPIPGDAIQHSVGFLSPSEIGKFHVSKYTWEQVKMVLGRVRYLELGYCANITDTGMLSLASITGLKSLVLWGCRNVTDVGVQSLTALTDLQHLNLSDCTKITDVGVLALASHTGLQHLNLTRCENITDASVRTLKEALPNIVVQTF